MESDATLQDWVRQYRVTWEIGPSQEIVEHRAQTVGFELHLFGQHAPDAHASPGCGECASLHEKLQAIAAAAFPQEERESRYDVESFDGGFHLRPETQWAPEVQLTVRIVHREGSLRPLDECERRCAEEIQQALRRLGVQPRTWSETRSAARQRT